MDLYPTPDNPLPEAAVCVALKTRDGMTLRAMRAGRHGGKGTVVIIGGRGDFMERYFETMRDLIARGFCVASVDLRGQGGSQRLLADRYRGHAKNFDGFDEDVRSLMTKLVVPFCPAPYFAIGHSTGGHVVLRVVQRQRWFSRAILCSPLLGIRYGPWPRPVAGALVAFANAARLGWMFLPGQQHRPMGREHFAGNPLHSDQRRWNRDSGTLEIAPRLGIGGPTFGWLRAARQSIAGLSRMAQRQRSYTPVLIVAAGNDRVVSNTAIRDFARLTPGIALVFVPGAGHELLSERDEYRDQFFAAFDNFIGQ